MLKRFYVEHITDAEGEWVVGRIEATLTEVTRRIDVSRGWFLKRIWPTWTEIGVARQVEKGFIEVPMLYEKGEYYQMPLPVRRELNALRAEIRDLKTELKEAKSVEKPRAKRTRSAREKDTMRPHRARFSRDTSFLKVLNSKNSLSGNTIISGFYKGIGQTKISKVKRERASKIFRKLRSDGFDLEDIAFAVDWTIENAKEELYDFAIIEHTIGQAIAASDKQELERKGMEEREKAKAEEELEREAEEREREKIEEYKANLSPENRAALRERAEAEISAAGIYKPGFISEPLISAKENELVRKELEE